MTAPERPTPPARFDIRSASAYLLTVDDARRSAVVDQAEAELGQSAERTEILIRAAELAHQGGGRDR